MYSRLETYARRTATKEDHIFCWNPNSERIRVYMRQRSGINITISKQSDVLLRAEDFMILADGSMLGYWEPFASSSSQVRLRGGSM